MILHNSHGLPCFAASERSITAFESALTSYLAARTDTLSLLDALLVEDADMPMAACFRGYLLKLAAHPRFSSALVAAIDQTAAIVQRVDASAREHAHLEALRHWHAERTGAAVTTLESILDAHPTDMLALRIAHYLHFYAGRGDRMRDSTARALPAWHADHPHQGFLLGMHAFGLEESAEYASALEFGCEAVRRNPADLWATHAVTHVYEMQGKHAEGLAWLDGLKGNWEGTNNFRYHLHWHEALLWLGIGEPTRALAIYDTALAKSVADDFYLDLCNNASLLWRLEFAGVQVGERWRVLAEVADMHVDDRELPFASLHYLIPLAVTGSAGGARLLTTLQHWAGSGTDQGEVCRIVGVALADAIMTSSAQPQTAAQALIELQAETFRIGGSHAQRDLFRQLALFDARRAYRHDLIDAIG